MWVTEIEVITVWRDIGLGGPTRGRARAARPEDRAATRPRRSPLGAVAGRGAPGGAATTRTPGPWPAAGP